MSEEERSVGDMVRVAREDLDLSGRALARLAHVDSRWLSRLEQGQYRSPDPRYLDRVATVLGLETSDLFVAADYAELPGFAPYLRSKYDLPADAIDQLQAHFDLLAEHYDREEGRSSEGSRPTIA
jgi:transcriptional regulator with XRE-family HTH domain